MFQNSSQPEDFPAETANTTSRNPYAVVYSKPNARAFSIAGALARFPMAMVGIGIIVMVEILYDSYELGGKVSAAYVIAQALCSPQIAKLVDRFGQSRVMRPMIVLSSLSLTALVISAVTHQPTWMLYVFAIGTGVTVGSMGAMVRARWSHIITDPRELHTAYSLEAAIDELIFVIGPIAATMLATNVAGWSGLVVPIVLMVAGGFWFLSQKETEPAVVPLIRGEKVPTVLLNPAMICLIAVFICTGVIFGAADVATIAFAEEVDRASMAGVVLGVFAGGSCISGLLYGSRQWASALWKRFVIGIVALGVLASLFFFATNLVMLALAMFIAGFSISPTLINGNNLVQLVVSPRQLTEGLTWVGTSLGVGVSIGSSVAGTRIDELGAHSGFTVVIAAAITQLIVVLAAVPTLKKRTEVHTFTKVD